jgi:hypothetical protein
MKFSSGLRNIPGACQPIKLQILLCYEIYFCEIFYQDFATFPELVNFFGLINDLCFFGSQVEGGRERLGSRSLIDNLRLKR